MGDNRFDFLEIGEQQRKAQQPPSDSVPEYSIPEPPTILTTSSQADDIPLAQVIEDDPRGYQSFIKSRDAEEGALGQAVLPTFSKYGLYPVEVFGERGIKAGQFNYPTGIAVDSAGILFIADSYNHRIQRVTPNSGVSVIGERGSAHRQFLTPYAIATDSRRSFYIVEQGNNRIQKYSCEGVLEMVLGRPGVGDGEFHGPTGIAISPATGDIFIADTGNSRVQRFTYDGRFVTSIGVRGSNFTRLSSPQALLVDAADNLYVADTTTNRVVHFDPIGRFVGYYPSTAATTNNITKPPQFREPRAICFDPKGILYIADSGPLDTAGNTTPGRVHAFDTTTQQVLTTITVLAQGLGPLMRPGGIAVTEVPPFGSQSTSRYNDLYCADTLNHRILRFRWT